MRHGSSVLPLNLPESRSCHESSHDAARKLYAGTGASGVENAPSRMHQTRVVCDACHTGRSGFVVMAHGDSGAAGAVARDLAHADASGRTRHPSQGTSTVASAGNIDCIHCHGTSYDGMLDEWQASVGEQLDRLGPMLVELSGKVRDDSPPLVLEALREAERNFALVSLDGSRGVHNASYALDALHVAAKRIDSVRLAVGSSSDPSALGEFPFRSQHGCSSCHSSLGRPAEVSRAERAFPHAKHLASGLDCATCHSVEEHGRPAIERNQCASCHHQESAERDVSDCASCHRAQAGMLSGTLPMLAEHKLGTMSQIECNECHGDAPNVFRPRPQNCVLCHEAGYDDLQRTWQSEIDAAVEQLELELAAAADRAVAPGVLARVRSALDAIRADGSRGAHNFELATFLLGEASKALAP